MLDKLLKVFLSEASDDWQKERPNMSNHSRKMKRNFLRNHKLFLTEEEVHEIADGQISVAIFGPIEQKLSELLSDAQTNKIPKKTIHLGFARCFAPDGYNVLTVWFRARARRGELQILTKPFKNKAPRDCDYDQFSKGKEVVVHMSPDESALFCSTEGLEKFFGDITKHHILDLYTSWTFMNE